MKTKQIYYAVVNFSNFPVSPVVRTVAFAFDDVIMLNACVSAYSMHQHLVIRSFAYYTSEQYIIKFNEHHYLTYNTWNM